MPKAKKQKLHHPNTHANGASVQAPPSAPQSKSKTQSQTTALTHEEIWDDSALLRSWDDAVREYDFYHSIHARGEDVEDVLRRVQMEEQQQQQQQQKQKQLVVEEEEEEGEEGEINEDPAPVPAPAPAPAPAEVCVSVQADAGASIDQTLENVKMAYYWAGYYSGMHDAQRRWEREQRGREGEGEREGGGDEMR